MIESLQEVLDKKCRFRVSDFEIAQVRAFRDGLRIVFSNFIYHEPTSFIWKVVGVVSRRNGDRIRVEWDFEGRASIGDERFPEFDLTLE